MGAHHDEWAVGRPPDQAAVISCVVTELHAARAKDPVDLRMGDAKAFDEVLDRSAHQEFFLEDGGECVIAQAAVKGKRRLQRCSALA